MTKKIRQGFPWRIYCASLQGVKPCSDDWYAAEVSHHLVASRYGVTAPFRDDDRPVDDRVSDHRLSEPRGCECIRRYLVFQHQLENELADLDAICFRLTGVPEGAVADFVFQHHLEQFAVGEFADSEDGIAELCGDYFAQLV